MEAEGCPHPPCPPHPRLRPALTARSSPVRSFILAPLPLPLGTAKVRGGAGAEHAPNAAERGGGHGGTHHDGGTRRGTLTPQSKLRGGGRWGPTSRGKGGTQLGRSQLQGDVTCGGEVSQLRVTPRGPHTWGVTSREGSHWEGSTRKGRRCGSHTGDLTLGGHHTGGESRLGRPQEKVTSGNNIGRGHTWGGHTCGTSHHITMPLRVWRDAQQRSPKSRVITGCPWGGGSGDGGPAVSEVWGHQQDRLALIPSLGTSRACSKIHPEDPKTRLAGSRDVPPGLRQMLPVCRFW